MPRLGYPHSNWSILFRTAASILMSGGRGRLKPSPGSFLVASMPGLLPLAISLVAWSSTSDGPFHPVADEVTRLILFPCSPVVMEDEISESPDVVSYKSKNLSTSAFTAAAARGVRKPSPGRFFAASMPGLQPLAAPLERSHFATGFFHFSPRNREKSTSVDWSTQLCSTASAARCASETRLPTAFPPLSICWKMVQC